MKKFDRKYVLIDEAAEELSISGRMIRSYIRSGCPFRLNSKKIKEVCVEEVAAWMRANGKTGLGRNEVKLGNSPDIISAKLRKENAMADKYELDVKQIRGSLIEAEEVKKFISTGISSARAKFMALSGSISSQLVGLDAPEIESMLETRIREVLTDLAECLTAA